MTVHPIQAIAGKKDTIEAAQEIYGKVVNAVVCGISSVARLFTSETSSLASKTLLPFRAVSIVASTIFLGISIKSDVKAAKETERKYKVIPSFKILNSIGELLDNASTFLYFFTSIAPKALMHVATSLGIAAIPLQVFGIVEKSMKIHSLRKQGREFRVLKDTATSREALKSIRSKKGSLSFFRMVDHTQSVAIQKIYRGDDEAKKTQAVSLVDRKITHNKKVHALQLALTIMSTVGIILLLTVSPAAPFLWGALGVGTLSGIGLGLYSHFSNKKFTNALTELQPA